MSDNIYYDYNFGNNLAVAIRAQCSSNCSFAYSSHVEHSIRAKSSILCLSQFKLSSLL